ncbi:TetR/AcrR family transcriptional regulator [Petroclostridium sp. X23]|uniref:TetR/AcrR family transcriptional regulator n=1 Tax=Petroclostridium sp. X23 TaxID=3045146 RepID=UPI0024ADFA98|nr:TetR/AcrR family transcriptional regulator [Petroclostridium sp. X23]WHH61337.1 TetR/AcrR family transcriptional regulator [Petroclostridium sp. X23]
MQNKKTASNKKRSAETKGKILKSAEVLFKEHGFDNTSVDSIVKKVGISKGAFYVHFNSKDEIIAHSINAAISKIDIDLDSIINTAEDDTPVTATLLKILERVSFNKVEELGYPLNKNAAIIQINKTINHDLLMNYNKALYSAAFRLITLGIERGEFKTTYSADAIAGDFVTTVRGFIFEWISNYPDMKLNQSLQEHFKIYLAGLISQGCENRN